MKIHNVRSPEQWQIISRHIDFKGKTVLDLGCGRGDILTRAFDAGAMVFGVDCDEKNIIHIKGIRPEIDVKMYDMNIDATGDHSDVIICFSVLPYLRYPESTLEWINFHSGIAFIECQYAGDGPGFRFLANNDDMREWLLEVGQFKKVEVIGHTLVSGRNKNRFIWMCE